MIVKMARGRTGDGRDVKRGRPPTVIEDNNGRLITDIKEALRIWADTSRLLNGKEAASCLEHLSSVVRDVGVEEP